MIKKLVIISCLMSFVCALKAQTDSKASDLETEIDTNFEVDIDTTLATTARPKKRKVMEIALETTLMQINSKFPFQRMGLNGSLELGYYPSQKVAFGLFYARMNDINPDKTYYIIDTKVINIASSELSNYGAYINYMVYQKERVKIIPELQFGYGRYRAISANFDINDTKNTIEFNLMTIQPKLRFIYDFSRVVGLGLSAGYLIPINYINRSSFKEYNIQNMNVGLYLRFRI